MHHFAVSLLQKPQGDSGGPLVCKENGRYVLRGAVSWGESTCSTNFYTVFARISNFIDWINNKISGEFKFLYSCVKRFPGFLPLH